MTRAKEIRTAAATLRDPLPEPYRPAPRLVHTDTENLDGIAFCWAHEGPAEHACDRCRVIDIHEPHLAALIVSLLRGREPLAAWLDGVSHIAEGLTQDPHSSTWQGMALAVARPINGGGQ